MIQIPNDELIKINIENLILILSRESLLYQTTDIIDMVEDNLHSFMKLLLFFHEIIIIIIIFLS